MTSIVGWTGHRPDLFQDPARAREVVLELAQSSGAHSFVVGGQRGVDTWAAEAALTLNVPFLLILPFEVPEFTADWAPADRDVLAQHVIRASAVRVAGGYSERNQLVATSCDLLIAVWTGRQGGGTAETIDFARRAGTPLREVHLPAASATESVAGRGI